MARTSLKVHLTCPICDGTEVLHAPVAAQFGESSNQRYLPIVRNGDQHLGSYSVYLCASCGFAEWFAPPDALAELRAEIVRTRGRASVELLQGPAAPPYR